MINNKIEESVFDSMNKIDDEADAEVIPVLHCETCGAELDPFGNCEHCGPETKPLGEYQITVGEPDGSTFTYDFDNFDDAHKFACNLEPDEEIAETNQAYKDAYAAWIKTQD